MEFCAFFCSKTKGSCKSYVDTCHTSDKGKGRGSPTLANSPAPRHHAAKKGSSATPSQAQKKPKVSLYYSKYKPSSTTASGAITVDEEHEDLTPEAPLSPEPPLSPVPDVCNNNEPAFISQLDKKMSADFKKEQSNIEDSLPAAVMFPMEMPAGFPGNVTLSPGPRPGLLMCSPMEKSCTEHYAQKMDSDKRDSSELEVGHIRSVWYFFFPSLMTGWKKITVSFTQQLREDEKGQKKKAQSAETLAFPGNSKGKRSRRKTENISR